MATYNDLYVRDNFADTGSVPTSGVTWESPDIIPYQTNMLTWDSANATYGGPDIGQIIITGQVNNIYVRARNLNTSAGSGTVNLYYADASLFNLPSTWTQLGGASGLRDLPFVDGKGNTSIASSVVALCNPAFVLTNFTGNAHYCIIAVVQTTAHPTGIPTSFSSNAAFSNWVMNTPAVAQRNISYQASSLMTMIRNYSFGNINSTAAYFRVRVVGRGFDIGTPVLFQCTNQQCPVNQNLTLPPPDSLGNQITGFDVTVPGNFRDSFMITATAPGKAFPSGATLITQYYQYADSANAFECALANRMAGFDASSASATAMLIKLGECTVVVK